MARHVQRVMVMYGGTVVEAGLTAAVFEQRAHPHARLYGAARPENKMRGTLLPTIPAACPLSRFRRGLRLPRRASAVQPSTTAGAPPPAVDVGGPRGAPASRIREARS